MISSKPSNITVSQSACKKTGLLFSKSKHSKGSHDQNMTVSTISAELLILLLPDLVWWYMIISQNALWRNGIVVFKVIVTANFKKLMNVCPDDIFWSIKQFTTKLGIVMHHYEPDCLLKRLVCCLQGQGHSEGSYNQNMTIYVFWSADVLSSRPRSQWRIIKTKYDFVMCLLNC